MPTNVCLPLLKSHFLFEWNVILLAKWKRMSEWARERDRERGIQANHSGWICAMMLPGLFSTFTFVRFFCRMHLALRTTSRSRHKYRPEILSGQMVDCPLRPNIVHLCLSNINEYSSVACLLLEHTNRNGKIWCVRCWFFHFSQPKNFEIESWPLILLITFIWYKIGRFEVFAGEQRTNWCAPFLWIWFVNIA